MLKHGQKQDKEDERCITLERLKMFAMTSFFSTLCIKNLCKEERLMTTFTKHSLIFKQSLAFIFVRKNIVYVHSNLEECTQTHIHLRMLTLF